MTQEQKELLLKDLCARLPYGVKVIGTYDTNCCSVVNTIEGIFYNNYISIDGCNFDISNIKLYLFPLSSMTKEQKKELEKLYWNCDNYEISNNIEYVYHNDCFMLIDWFSKNHIDYRGLIQMGLAIDATNKNIY